LSIISLIEYAYQQKATDLHLSSCQTAFIRVQGKLRPVEQIVILEEDIYSFLSEILDKGQQEKFIQRVELDLSFRHPYGYRLRLHIYWQQRLPSLSFRFLREQIPLPHELHLPPVLLELIKKEQGLFLVTGPTGSGKSTTIASLIQYLNQSHPLRIITLEDPIEYVHTPKQAMIEQREIGKDTISFSQGIHSALRQDPDVILIGELRDAETIHAAIRAAEAGRLVLGTLHTSRTFVAIHRLIDAFPAEQQIQIRSQLAMCLVGVVSQHLFPKLHTSDERVVAVEVLINTSAVSNLIRSGQLHQLPSLLQAGKSVGMQTLEMSYQQLVQKKWVDASFVSH
jgi:twitching motility protein PilT